MNDTQYKVAGMLLRAASDSYANHGCNDFTLPNTPEHQELWRDAMTWSEGRAPENGPGTGENIFFLDWILMGYLAHTLDQERFHTLAGITRDELLGLCKMAIAVNPDIDEALKMVMSVSGGTANPKIARAALEAELLRGRHMDLMRVIHPTLLTGRTQSAVPNISMGPSVAREPCSTCGHQPGSCEPPPRKFTNIQVSRTDDRIEGAKRQHAPYIVKATCACGHEREISLNDQYLSYPTWGETETIHLYCPECELEQDCRVRVDINVELEEGR